VATFIASGNLLLSALIGFVPLTLVRFGRTMSGWMPDAPLIFVLGIIVWALFSLWYLKEPSIRRSAYSTSRLGEAYDNPVNRFFRWLTRTDHHSRSQAADQYLLGGAPRGQLLLGVILAFQSAIPMKKFGAEIFVADLIGLAMLRELGPLMSAILLAGRSGAAFAAEIGTMTVNQEVDALTTMGLDPVRFLVTPRIIAALLMTPLLTLFADLVSLIGGAMTLQSFSIPWVTFVHEVEGIVDFSDFMAGFVKSFVFAILIAGIGCLRGLQTAAGASAVGDAATRAVVSGIILLVVVDGLFAVIYFVLDI
jgi:ABC transport permease subunit